MSDSIKKIIIILGIILILVIILLMGLNWYRKTGQTENEQNISQNQNIPIPALPAEVGRVELDNINDPGEAKAAIKNYTEKVIQGEVISGENGTIVKETYIVDKNGQAILLKTFSELAGFKINPELEQIIDEKKYSLFLCSGKNNKNDFGLILNIRRFSKDDEKINSRDLENRIKNSLQKWEKTIFTDLHEIIFPQISFSDSQLNQGLVFKNGKYRYADIILPDGSVSSINYGNFGSPIVITTSLDCMEEATKSLFDD